MDRYDESRHVNDTDESPSRSHSGDVLGLGGSVVPKTPGDPSASSDPESARRRRERAMEDESAWREQQGSDRQRSGATGIDMGSGGQGTDVSGS